VKPIITIYSGDSPDETKKFEGFITAAFWIGFEHTEGDVSSVKVRQPNESYDIDVAELSEFATLLVQRQINFSVEFFNEPTPMERSRQAKVSTRTGTEAQQPETSSGERLDYEAELARLKEEYESGVVNKNQYEAKKGTLLKKWKEKVEGTLRG